MPHGPEVSEQTPLLPHNVPAPYPAVSGTGLRRSPVRLQSNAEYIISVFHPDGSKARSLPPVDDTAFMAGVNRVRESIEAGVYPRMISLGTSGSYFALIRENEDVSIFGVFKPMDEEPYGNLKCVAS